MALNAQAFALLEKIVKDCPSNCFRAAAKNGELQKRVNPMDGKNFETDSSVEQVQTKLSAISEECDALAAKCKRFALKIAARALFGRRSGGPALACDSVGRIVQYKSVESAGYAQN